MKRLAAAVVLALAAATLAVPAFAEMQEGSKDSKGMTFEQRKNAMLSRIDKRISTLQDLRGCVSGAKSHDDMKKCKDRFREEREDMHEKTERGR